MSASGPIWVTGLGVVSPAGIGVPTLRTLIAEGRSAVSPLAPPSHRSAGICPSPPRVRDTRRLDRSARLFAAAAEEAWRSAGLSQAPPIPARCDVIEGSSLGPLADVCSSLRAQPGGRRARHPSDLVRFMLGAGGAAFARVHGIEGAVFHISAGSVSSGFALIEAVARLEANRTDLVVAGGAECPLEEEVFACFDAAGILATGGNAGAGCRPFDLDRDGTVLGEGAGVLVLERAAQARRRGARPLAVILGTGWSCESYGMTGPDPRGRGVTEAARQAVRDLPRNGLGWVKTHGTGTRLNDAAECAGLAALLGGELPAIPLTSLKPALGHSLGASAAVETVATVLALRDGFVPPTLNTRRLDPASPRCTVALEPMAPRAPVALLLAESFGGRCAAWALGSGE